MSDGSEQPQQPPDEYKIDASVGDIDLSVSGEDEEWVNDTFNAKLELLREIQAEQAEHHHVGAGAGWMSAEVSADSPEEAMAIWLDMWERMLEDIDELSDRQREQAGLSRRDTA